MKAARWPFFVLILPLIPLLNITVKNWLRLNPWYLLKPTLVLVTATVLITVILWLFFRDVHQSAFMALTIFFLFFSFRLFRKLFAIIGNRNDIAVMAIQLLLLILLLMLINKKRIDWQNLTPVFNWAALGMLSLVALLLIFDAFSVQRIRFPELLADSVPDESIAELNQDRYPDIVYLVLDSYGGEDILESRYGFDNAPFITSLKNLGFMVPAISKSNYNQTVFSLCAALNMNDMQEIVAGLPEKSRDRRPLVNAIRNSRLFSFLSQRGYQLSAFDSGYGLTELRGADEYISNFRHIKDFDSFLMNMTPLGRLGKRWAYWSHAERVSATIEGVESMKPSDRPRIVFAHVICPHPPFIFQRDGHVVYPETGFFHYFDGSYIVGKSISREMYRKRYIDQLVFINQRVTTCLNTLTTRYRQLGHPLAIVIQGDHGPGSGLDQYSFENTDLVERFSILNAYYFNGETAQIPDRITPANSFRLLLNHFFHLSLPMGEDRSFYSSWDFPFRLIPVPD